MPKLMIDRLTGLPNFLSLIENFESVRSKAELFVGLDLAKHSTDYTEKNRGDRDDAARCLGAVLRRTQKQVPECIGVYRIGGDEFLVALSAGNEEAAAALASMVSSEFRRCLVTANLPLLDLQHTVVALHNNYNASPLSSLLAQLHLGLSDTKPEWQELALEPATSLADWMLRHISETLQSLHEARYLAATDDISGLPNYREARRRFSDLLAQEYSRDEGFSVLFVDGDNLKVYNQIDYDAGNRMIRQLARTLTGLVRENDFVARWLCGDEFIILLPKTNRAVARQVAERLRAGVAKAFEDWPHPVTVSIGIASCPADGTTLEELTRHMTTAAAEAKSMGKNRVV